MANTKKIASKAIATEPFSAQSTSSVPTPPAKPSQPAVTHSRQKVFVFGKEHRGIAVGEGALNPHGRFTIGAWVSPATEVGKQVIYAEGEALLYLEGGELKFQTTSATPAISSVGAELEASHWYHVAVVRAGSCPGETRLYINGLQNDDQSAIPPVLLLGSAYLAGLPDGSKSGFQGKLLEVRIWRYAKSQDDLQNHMQYRLTGRELGLRRYWQISEGSGTKLYDKSNHHPPVNVMGEATWEDIETPIKLKLDPQERLTRSTGLKDYAFWFQEIAKQQNPAADPLVRRGRIWS
jgi:cyanobactin cluster PatC/TenC/TruC protein